MKKWLKRVSTMVLTMALMIALMPIQALADDPAPSPNAFWLFKDGTHDVINFYEEPEKDIQYSNSPNAALNIGHTNPEDLTGIGFDAANDLIVFNNVKINEYTKGQYIYSNMMRFYNCKGIYGKGNSEINAPVTPDHFGCIINGYTDMFKIELEPGATLKVICCITEYDSFDLNTKIELGEGVKKTYTISTSSEVINGVTYTSKFGTYIFTRSNDISHLKSKASLSASKFEYTGSAITPPVSFTGLTKDTDYTVSYSDNTNVGTATVTITGNGNYSGSINLQFKITPMPIEKKKTVSALAATECDYTGNAIEPEVTITGLTVGKDFTVSYENNIDPGTGTATITGMGNYSGTFTLDFTIKEASEKTSSLTDSKTGSAYSIKTIGDISEASYNSAKSKSEKTISVPNTVTLPDGSKVKVTSIARNACKGNKKLTKVTIGNNVKEIGDNAFNGCSKLTNLKFGKKVEKIGNGAVRKCKSLKNVTIPASTKTIGNNAFDGDSNLKVITINCKNLSSVGKNAIRNINPNAVIKLKGNAKQKKAAKKLITNKKTGYKKTMKIK